MNPKRLFWVGFDNLLVLNNSDYQRTGRMMRLVKAASNKIAVSNYFNVSVQKHLDSTMTFKI